MYRKFLSLVLSVAIILYVCAGNMVDAYAAIKSDVQQEEKINQLEFEMEERIADNASDYIKEKYSVILKSVRDNSKELDIRKELLDNAILGKPFMVYDMDASVQYEEIYYPVVHRKTDEVIFVITVIGTTQGWQYKIGTDMVDELNKLDYDAEGKYVFYEEDEEIIGQSLSKKVWFDDEKVNNTVSEEDFMKTADKALTNFQDTKKVDIEACVQAGKNIIDSSNVAVSELGYFYLGIYNSKGQGNYGLCWAASVATIVNYMKDKDITAKQVANKMGIGYDDGAAIEQAQAALRMYNLYFWRRLEYATFDMVKLNIQNYAPMYMRGSGYDSSGKLSGHAVTIYGYKETGGEKCLMIWDPAANENKGDTYMVSYNGAGTVYTSAPNSTIFTWQGTLLCYK